MLDIRPCMQYITISPILISIHKLQYYQSISYIAKARAKPPIIAIPPDTTLDIAALDEAEGDGVEVEVALPALDPVVVFETTSVEVEGVAEDLPVVAGTALLEVVIVLFEN